MQEPLLERLVSLQLDATDSGASLTLITNSQAQFNQAAGTRQQSGNAPSGNKADTGWRLQVLKVLRHHVAQATEVAASVPGQQSNDVECKKVSHTQGRYAFFQNRE